MKTFNEYYPQGPRDQENERDQSKKDREEGREQNRPGTPTHPEEDPKIPTVTPETDNGGPAARGKDGIGNEDEELIPIKKDPKEDLLGDEEETDEDEDEMDEEEDDMDDEGEDDVDSEPGRDTSSSANKTGDDFTSPANNPNEANFEDPAQNRKTDSMTDHEPRIPGI